MRTNITMEFRVKFSHRLTVSDFKKSKFKRADGHFVPFSWSPVEGDSLSIYVECDDEVHADNVLIRCRELGAMLSLFTDKPKPD